MNCALPSECSAVVKRIPSAQVAIAYMLLITGGTAVYHFVAAREVSAALTIGAMVQTFAFALLAMQITYARHAQGISARALGLEAAALIFRLSSTVWLDGYLPVDASGNWMYQALDICSLALVLWLAYQVVVVHKGTYQEAEDTFPAFHVAMGAVVMAFIFHPDMDDLPLFDSFWMAGLNISAIAVLPQLWLTARAGGRMATLTGHYVAGMAISQLFSAVFLWHAWDFITCKPLIPGVNHGVLAMGFAHVVHMFLLADFTYCYIRSLLKGGISSSMDFGSAVWV